MSTPFKYRRHKLNQFVFSLQWPRSESSKLVKLLRRVSLLVCYLAGISGYVGKSFTPHKSVELTLTMSSYFRTHVIHWQKKIFCTLFIFVMTSLNRLVYCLYHRLMGTYTFWVRLHHTQFCRYIIKRTQHQHNWSKPFFHFNAGFIKFFLLIEIMVNLWRKLNDLRVSDIIFMTANGTFII